MQSHSNEGVIDLTGLEEEYNLVIKRLRLLHGFGETQHFETVAFRSFINFLKEHQYVEEAGENSLSIKVAFVNVMNSFESLVGKDLKESLGKKLEVT